MSSHAVSCPPTEILSFMTQTCARDANAKVRLLNINRFVLAASGFGEHSGHTKPCHSRTKTTSFCMLVSMATGR